MKTIKEICEKYNISHRQLGILMGYNRHHIQKINTGRRKMTPRFAMSLERVEALLKNGNAKILK